MTKKSAGYHLLKSHLNLYAVLPNLEDMVECDKEMADFVRDWDISIQFSVLRGPSAFVTFRDGRCRVDRGKTADPTVRLLFTSPKHLNAMMDGKSNPVPTKGFRHLKFLANEFSRLTQQLEYYLKPEADALQDPAYIALNTRMVMTTAAFAAREIAQHDPVGQKVAAHIRDGAVVLKVLPDGPAVNICFQGNRIEPCRGDVEQPMACMTMKNARIANDFMNGNIDTFTAIAAGDVMIRGQIPMLDALGLIFDRIPVYLD